MGLTVELTEVRVFAYECACHYVSEADYLEDI